MSCCTRAHDIYGPTLIIIMHDILIISYTHLVEFEVAIVPQPSGMTTSRKKQFMCMTLANRPKFLPR
jgi:hypothetical protein